MSLINSWEFEDPINSIFDNLIRDLNVARRGDSRSGTRSGTRSGWSPLLDVHETDKEFLVNAELPGLDKDKINIDVHDNVLTISGETKKDQKYQEGNTRIQERRFGSFTRSIPLPSNVKADDITAKFDNGLLELNLPKSAPSGRRIQVQ